MRSRKHRAGNSRRRRGGTDPVYARILAGLERDRRKAQFQASLRGHEQSGQPAYNEEPGLSRRQRVRAGLLGRNMRRSEWAEWMELEAGLDAANRQHDDELKRKHITQDDKKHYKNPSKRREEVDDEYDLDAPYAERAHIAAGRLERKDQIPRLPSRKETRTRITTEPGILGPRRWFKDKHYRVYYDARAPEEDESDTEYFSAAEEGGSRRSRRKKQTRGRKPRERRSTTRGRRKDGR